MYTAVYFYHNDIVYFYIVKKGDNFESALDSAVVGIRLGYFLCDEKYKTSEYSIFANIFMIDPDKFQLMSSVLFQLLKYKR